METLFEPLASNRLSVESNSLSPFINYVNTLEGYKTKFKNLHWSAINDTTHIRIDEFISILSDFQDLIAEEAQGIYQDFGPNVIKGRDIMETDPIYNMKNLLDTTKLFYQSLGEDIIYVGMRSGIETFITECNRYIYLLRKAMR